MATALWPVQIEIYQRLAADATLAGMVTGIYDETPEGAGLPYVVIGEATQVPDDQHDAQGLNLTETVHIWSGYRGHREALAIEAELDRLLDRQPLTLAGFQYAGMAKEHVQPLIDTAATQTQTVRLRHTVVRYRIWLTEGS